MRFAFLGTVEFSRRTLEALLATGADVKGVLTLPRAAATFNADWADLEPVATRHGVPCHRIERIDDGAALDLVRRLAPDVLLVLGWSHLVPTAVLEIPPHGCIGSHPALLPAGRGRHPITWALVEGRSETGLTLFYLDEGVDSGDIVWQRSFPIALEDDAAAVYERVCELGCEAVRELVPLLESGGAHRIPQNHARATTWRKRTDHDRIIRWEAPALTIYNQIRGLARPYVGATTTLEGNELVVLRARPPVDAVAGGALPNVSPGTVLSRSGSELHVRTGDGLITLLEVDPRGGRLPAAGDRLGSTT